MFSSKNTGGWALALVALGLFIGLVLRDLIRKDKPPEEGAIIATMLPQQEESPRGADDVTERFERVTTQCLPFIVTLQHSALADSPQSFSGVLMSAEGHILTSAGLVRDARRLAVILSNKKSLEGEVLGLDPLTDIAVVKITAKGLKGIRQGNSEDLRPGQWVMALGNATGDRHAATAGVINLKGRGNVWLADEEDFLQTDAVINANNAGGALVDLQGRLVGINLLREASSDPQCGMNRGVPINMAREVMRHVIAEGKFTRGALAVQMQDLDAPLAAAFGLQERSGVLISEVGAERAATNADLQRGDVILKWGEKKVSNRNMLRELVAATKPGTVMPVTLLRSGAELMRAITVTETHTGNNDDELAPPTHASLSANRFGIVIEPLTPLMLRELKSQVNALGVLVAHVTPGSAAELGGLREGDIIQEWEGKSVTSVKECRARMAASAQRALLYVRRGKQGLYCALELFGDAPRANAP
jgi:serine protease Do